MPKVDDKQIGVARVYSRALLDLAEQRQVQDAVEDELRELAKLVESDPRFARFISSPLVEPQDREKALERLFRGKLEETLADALQIMNRKGRLALLPTVAVLYHEELEQRRGRVEATVCSAVALNDALRERLRKALAEKTGHEVELIEEVDETLLGGFVVRVGDYKYDGTVVQRIGTLHGVLVERARQEIYRSRLAQSEG